MAFDEGKKRNIHEGHRIRIKRKLLNNPDTILPHEALEILLFYSTPQKNTNPIAHELLEHFGSLSAVIDATPADLMKVKGIKEHSASLIKLLPTLFSMYVNDKYNDETRKVSAENLREYISPLFFGKTVEQFYVIMLDGEDQYITTVKMTDGTTNSSAVHPREVVRKVLEVNALNVILVHNHPNGVVTPSASDLKVTETIIESLAVINVRVLDHIIVANDTYASVFARMDRVGLIENEEKIIKKVEN
ncbi:MAG: DNA repair protein RadC [Clostridia bacterium]|nr:DNA repair protein RadC [Clostridia bacterium]